jgi:hypothetical protein
MAYVDLNLIRAGMPEESEFTSIYARIRELQAGPRLLRRSVVRCGPLLASWSRRPSRKVIDVRSYLALVD